MKISDLIKPFAQAEGPPPLQLWPFFRWSLSGAWPVLIVAAIVSSAAGSLEVVTAYFLGVVIDSAAGETAGYLARNAALLAWFAIYFVLLRPAIFGLSSTFNSVIVGPNVNLLALSRLYRWTLGQSVGFFDDDFAGRIAQKQLQTARALSEVVVDTIHVVAFALATLVGSAVLLVFMDLRVALALVVWICLYLGLISWFLPRVRKIAGRRASMRAGVSGQVVDAITNIKTVKLFAHDAFEDAEALKSMAHFREASLEFGILSAWFRFSLMVVAGILPVLLIGGTVLLWYYGFGTAGDIAAAGAVAIRISQMTGWVSFSLMGIYAHIGEIEDGMNTLAVDRRVMDQPNAKDLKVERGAIHFDNVSFHYSEGGAGVEDISLNLKAGEKLGIVGSSGAGKSTLVAILLRLYDVDRGTVSIDGQAIEAVTQESLRKEIGMVTQETAMFNRSARENILYGNPLATDSQMVSAAERAEASDFIKTLRDHKGRLGYEAHLGERGVKLSGGQRQRIALARTILKDAPILVLDEATSALDSEVEAAIQDSLETVMEGKTVLAIAHRLSTISKMDRIVVMEQGRIVEEGTHEALLTRGGLYSRYWSRQSGGFIGTQDPNE